MEEEDKTRDTRAHFSINEDNHKLIFPTDDSEGFKEVRRQTKAPNYKGNMSMRRITVNVKAAMKYGLSMRRSLLLAIYCFIVCANQIGYALANTLPPNFMNYLPLFMALPMFGISVTLIEDWGMKTTLLLACTLQCLGILISKALVTGTTPFFGADLAKIFCATIGESLNSCAFVLLSNCITKFTGQWFGMRGRIVATALIVCIFEIGRDVMVWLFALYDEPNDAVIFKSVLWYGTAAESLFYLILVAWCFRN